MDASTSSAVEIIDSQEDASATPAPLSKNAQKKLAKAARFAEQKRERRAIEKEKKKQKKRERAEQQKQEGVDNDERPGKKARTDGGPKRPFGARIVVDLGFDELMSENVSNSICLKSCSSGINCSPGNQILDVSTRIHV